MLAVGVYLAKLGHTITFHTAELFRQKVEKAGLRFVGTTGKADIDYRHPINLEGQENMMLLEQANSALKQTIAEALPDLDHDLWQILQESPVDLILTSSMYFGAFPLLLRPGESRPPVIGCGVNPLMLSSVDCGPLSLSLTIRREGVNASARQTCRLRWHLHQCRKPLMAPSISAPFQHCLSFGQMPSIRSPICFCNSVERRLSFRVVTCRRISIL
jgi:hypothetical protein